MEHIEIMMKVDGPGSPLVPECSVDGATLCQRQHDGSWWVWFILIIKDRSPPTYDLENQVLVKGIRSAQDFVKAYLDVGKAALDVCSDYYDDETGLLDWLEYIEVEDPRMAADLAQFLEESGCKRFRDE